MSERVSQLAEQMTAEFNDRNELVTNAAEVAAKAMPGWVCVEKLPELRDTIADLSEAFGTVVGKAAVGKMNAAKDVSYLTGRADIGIATLGFDMARPNGTEGKPVTRDMVRAGIAHSVAFRVNNTLESVTDLLADSLEIE